MLFSSIEFLWYFLPVVFVLSRVLPRRAANGLLLVASLVFYAFGEPIYVLLMIFSITINYFFGFLISRQEDSARKLALAAAVSVNLLLLGYFKYFDFLARLINLVIGREVVELRSIVLPIGISFFTFQILTYVIDLYRKRVPLQKNIWKLALYISFFPQLIAGPIVNYGDIYPELDVRILSPARTAYGIKRFIYGLAKKVLIANTIALAADNIIALPLHIVPSGYLWLGYFYYLLQIYFDFSGYSDMAIGLGKMFGFDFLENFNYPYISKTVTEFWRRWHISLSAWFRDNLYIPLGGNRKGILRTCLNLLIVFVLTGLWHGAGFNFLAWGLWHGFFLILERLWLGKLLEKPPLKWLRRFYTMAVIYFGWILFRANGTAHAISTVVRMFAFAPGDEAVYFQAIGGIPALSVALLGALLSGPIQSMFPRFRRVLFSEEPAGLAQIALLALLFFLCITSLVSGTYNPFIYFRF